MHKTNRQRVDDLIQEFRTNIIGQAHLADRVAVWAAMAAVERGVRMLRGVRPTGDVLALIEAEMELLKELEGRL